MTLTEKNTLLFVGGYFSLAFAVFQISGVFWPPNAIKYFGGPAELSQTLPVIYALLCLGVALIVAVFGIYAFSQNCMSWLKTIPKDSFRENKSTKKKCC
jgi:hypothetical protein